MKLCVNTIWISALVASLCVNVFSQKVTVGYDKRADFTKPVTRPLLYTTVIGSVDYELKSKGLAKVETNGDLILVPPCGMEFGLNQAAGRPFSPTFSGPPPTFNATMWTGA